MVVGNVGQEMVEAHRDALERRVFREGMDLWKRQKDFERDKRIKEQREVREMLDSYWPWGRGTDAKPRGLRNLRLEELFPNKDYEKAKRFVGTLDIGRGGGGAPLVNSGRKVTRTREDPLLRFQFGSKDLRRCVDNTLRYKTSKENQREYKKELDKLVEEKKRKEQQDKTSTKLFHQEQGWSDHDTMKDIEQQSKESRSQDLHTYENFKRLKMLPPNKVAFHKKNFIPVGKNRKLSPLSNSKDEGVELVKLLARNRNHPPRIPLSSTDVTSDQNITGKSSIWSRQGSSYLKELNNQMICKQQQMKEFNEDDPDRRLHFSEMMMGFCQVNRDLHRQILFSDEATFCLNVKVQKEKELEFVRRHFSTWDAFWGRPGHGAPLDELKKRSLDMLLYPQMFPVGVH